MIFADVSQSHMKVSGDYGARTARNGGMLILQNVGQDPAPSRVRGDFIFILEQCHAHDTDTGPHRNNQKMPPLPHINNCKII